MAPHWSRLQSQHFRHSWGTRPVQFRTPNWKHQVLPPIIKLTLFYLVLHIYSYKYVQPKLFVVFCIESIQNTTNLLLLAFPKKYSNLNLSKCYRVLNQIRDDKWYKETNFDFLFAGM